MPAFNLDYHDFKRLLVDLENGKEYLPKIAGEPAIELFKYGATKETALTRQKNGVLVYYTPDTYTKIKSLFALCILNTFANYPIDSVNGKEPDTYSHSRINIHPQAIKYTIPFFRICYQEARNSAIQIGVKPDEININDCILSIDQNKIDIPHVDRDLTGVIGRIDGHRTMFYDEKTSNRFIDEVFNHANMHIKNAINNTKDKKQLKIIDTIVDYTKESEFKKKYLTKSPKEVPPYILAKTFGIQAGRQHVRLHRSPNEKESRLTQKGRPIKFNEISKFIDGLKQLTEEQQYKSIKDLITFANAHPEVVEYVENASIFIDFATKLGKPSDSVKKIAEFKPEQFAGFALGKSNNTKDLVQTTA